jgi:hypothetical protein
MPDIVVIDIKSAIKAKNDARRSEKTLDSVFS